MSNQAKIGAAGVAGMVVAFGLVARMLDVRNGEVNETLGRAHHAKDADVSQASRGRTPARVKPAEEELKAIQAKVQWEVPEKAGFEKRVGDGTR